MINLILQDRQPIIYGNGNQKDVSQISMIVLMFRKINV